MKTRRPIGTIIYAPEIQNWCCAKAINFEAYNIEQGMVHINDCMQYSWIFISADFQNEFQCPIESISLHVHFIYIT